MSFDIGCFSPPLAHFPLWKSRGCNVIVANVPPDGVSIADYLAAAADLGMTVWIECRAPAKPSVVSKLRGFGAWCLRDEPEGIDGTTGKPKLNPADYEAECHRLNVTGKTFGNFTGQVANCKRDFPEPADYRQYLRALGLWAADHYPANRGGDYKTNLNWWRNIINGMHCAGSAFNPWHWFIECGDQGINKVIGGRAPTLDEYVNQCREAKGLGAQGIIYFAHSFNHGSFAGYNVSPEIAAAMPAMAAELRAPPPDPPAPVSVKMNDDTIYRVVP